MRWIGHKNPYHAWPHIALGGGMKSRTFANRHIAQTSIVLPGLGGTVSPPVVPSFLLINSAGDKLLINITDRLEIAN
jgi:hypothetical protein